MKLIKQEVSQERWIEIPDEGRRGLSEVGMARRLGPWLP
jgi:predicted alternative tryptophan synthase beta-subunit